MNTRQKCFIFIIIVTVLASSFYRDFIRSDKAKTDALDSLKKQDHEAYEKQLNNAHLTLLHATMREIAILLQTKEAITQLAPQYTSPESPTIPQIDTLLEQTKHQNDNIKHELSHSPAPFKLYKDKIAASKARSKHYQAQLEQLTQASQKSPQKP